VGDYSFEFLMEEVAVAVQYKVPYVLVMLNNGYMGLIRQGEKYGYGELDYGVDLRYEGPGAYGMDHVAVMEAMGALGRRVTEPGDIPTALEWAVGASEEHRVPVLVEIITERDAASQHTDTSLRTDLTPLSSGHRRVAECRQMRRPRPGRGRLPRLRTTVALWCGAPCYGRPWG
jgi:tartronate-semialdehyde synthase